MDKWGVGCSMSEVWIRDGLAIPLWEYPRLRLLCPGCSLDS